MTVRKPLLVVISGPTGVGKTEMAIAAARHYKSEIVSADSRQIYKQLKIGVGRPSKEELKQVPHHFIGSHDIQQSYSAGDYETEAISVINSLFEKHNIVFLVGGTGLYIKAVVEGLDRFPEASKEQWQTLLEQNGIEFLQTELKRLDPEYYHQVDLQNPHRLIRALSVIEASGEPFSNFLKGAQKKRAFRTLLIAIQRDRPVLYNRINDRVDKMMSMGLLDEVKGLYIIKHLQSLQTVGYKELFGYLDGQHNLEYAVDKIKQHSRNYAKRQLTWLRNQGNWKMISGEVGSESIIKEVNNL